MDVKTAFLNGDLEKNVYMDQWDSQLKESTFCCEKYKTFQVDNFSLKAIKLSDQSVFFF